jgi:5-(carboxyamino)imidazole ribonucleotide mutase
MAIGGARKAGLLAVRMLASSDDTLMTKIVDFQRGLADLVEEKERALRASL